MTPPTEPAAPDLRLIVITDAALAAPRSVEEVVAAALDAGAPAIQLRDKSAMPADLFRQALRLREITRAQGALFFVNDRMDVALAAGADGVHLGAGDLPVRAAREAVRRLKPDLVPDSGFRGAPRPDRFLIGFSADDPAAARAAEADGADYIGCGAVFGTTSKPEVAGERIGADRLHDVVAAVRIPVVGIGGITADNVRHVAAAGAAGAAVLGAVMTAEDVERETERLLASFCSRALHPPP